MDLVCPTGRCRAPVLGKDVPLSISPNGPTKPDSSLRALYGFHCMRRLIAARTLVRIADGAALAFELDVDAPAQPALAQVKTFQDRYKALLALAVQNLSSQSPAKRAYFLNRANKLLNKQFDQPALQRSQLRPALPHRQYLSDASIVEFQRDGVASLDFCRCSQQSKCMTGRCPCFSAKRPCGDRYQAQPSMHQRRRAALKGDDSLMI